jgi:hypothetical protein
MVNGQTLADAIGDPGNDLAKLVGANKDNAKVVSELFLRILNRPPTEKEVKECLATFDEVEVDHQKLFKAMQDREKESVTIKAAKEKERVDLLAKAKTELEAYEKQIAPKVAEAEKARKARIDQATAEVKKYDATLASQLPAWEKKKDLKVEWHSPKPLTATTGGAKSDSKLKIESDSSITASGKAGRDTYTVTIDTELKEITAVRLEVIADPAHPKGGPGRSPDGNFVLTEFVLLAQPKGTKELPKKIELVKPLADFSQKNFDVKFAVDGDEGSRDKGWAVSPATGSTHWATFQLKEPLKLDKGAIFTVKLISQFVQPGFVPGRFRVSFATQKAPVGLSIAEEYKAILETPADKRTKEQKDVLTKYFRSVDDELRKRREAVAEAQKPLPVDPRLVELKNTADDLSRPIGEDERLVQLRNDVQQSSQQLTNRRLTAAQDIAWALINSPAFLFNH